MSDGRDLAGLSREELVRQNAALVALVAELRAEIEQLKRSQKRQAAPYSKGTPAAQPKRAGRKRGEGTFTYRQAPPLDAASEPPVVVPVTAPDCPHCGGTLVAERVDEVSVIDVPEVVRPQVRRYQVAVCRCRTCGRPVRGQHPDVAPDQYGATAHRVGARTMAAAHALHYGQGVPQQKVPTILRELTGVRLTQGALAQDAQRRTEGSVGATYQQLRAAVPQAARVHTDDTSWRVGGKPAQLMVFVTATATVYQIRDRHRNEEVREVVPADYAGVLCTDRGKSYDAKELAGVQQQKCLSHVQRSLSQVLVTKHGRGRSFAKQLKALLTEAQSLWRAEHAGAAPDYATLAQRLRGRITQHLRDRDLPDPDNQRLLNQLGRHHDAGNLVRFLDDPRIEPTNNLAERELRPAVIARKVSHCSQNQRGAASFAALASVTRTLARSGGSLVDGLTALFRSGSLPAPLPP